MSAQALATVMGPPLMLHSASAVTGADIDHAQPIAVLKYLLQIWPQPHHSVLGGTFAAMNNVGMHNHTPGIGASGNIGMINAISGNVINMPYVVSS